MNEGVNFFDRTTLNRGKNEITQGGETCDIRFSTSTSPFKEQKLGAPAISFFAERIIHFSNFNAIVDTLGDFYYIYDGASAENPGLDWGALIGDAVASPEDTPGSLKLDVLFFKNQTLGSLREKAAGFEDALHYMFGNAKVSEVEPKPSGKSPIPVDTRTPQEKELDEIYYSPVEVFIRDVTAEAIRSWGAVDDKTKRNIEIAVRRAVREGLERGNERANAINNINMACDDVLAVFQGLTRENYNEKMAQYIEMVTSKPELKNFLVDNLTEMPSQPIPAEYLRKQLLEYNSRPENAGKITGDLMTMGPEKLQETYTRVTLIDYFAIPGNETKKPSNFDSLTQEQLEQLAEANNVPLIINSSLKFNSIEYVCSQSAMYGEHLELAELEKNKAIISSAEQEQSLSYWSSKYGARFSTESPERDNAPRTIRSVVASRLSELETQLASEKHKLKAHRLAKEIQQVKADLDIIDGKPDAQVTSIRIINGQQIVIRPPQVSVNIMNSNDDNIRRWDAYTSRLTEIAPKNDALLLLSCCSILYDLNLNKLGGEIITANEILEKIGYDSAAGGIKYGGEEQKQALSILNNLFFLNEEQRVNFHDGGQIHQTTQRFQNLVYHIYDKYEMPVINSDGKKVYPHGKLPMDKLFEEIKELGQNPDSPFFGRSKELLEQLTTALGVAKEGYAINNFNPVKACFAQMDPKLKDLGYRKMIMDYYKKEGLLPAKAVTVFKIQYKLDQEYKPSPVINQPPTVDPPPENETGIELLDYCEEVGHALAKEHKYTAATKSKVNRTSEEQSASEAAEHKLLENLQRVYKRCEQHPQMFLYLTNAVISGKNIVDAEGNLVAETSVNKNGGVQIKVLNEKGEFVTFRFTADQRLMFSKFAPINGPMVMGEDGKPDFLDNGLKKYFDEIQAYNASARSVMAILKENPDISEDDLKARCGISRAELKTWCSSLKFGGDYTKGIASSIFPKGMNHGVKLAFSLLTPATFVPERDASGKIVGGRFAAQIYGVQCMNMQHYARLLSRVGAQVEKDMKAIMGSENFKMFGSLMHLRVVENQFIFAPAYKVGPKGGLEVRDNMDVNSDKVHAVPHKMEIDKIKEENPLAKIYIVEGGKPIDLTIAEYTTKFGNEPVIQLESGVFIPASQVDQFVDVLAAEAKGKKRTIGVQEAGGGGKINGLAERMDIVKGLELNDPALVNGDVPAPDVLVDPSIDGVVPETPVA